MLRIENVSVEVDGKRILSGVTMEMRGGEINILMGPNASGKSTLLSTIMGLPRYRVVSGRILLDGKDITGLPPWERARRGIAMAFQNPPRIRVRLGYLVEKMRQRYGGPRDLDACLEKLGVERLFNRNMYEGFSGGEAKRTELYLAMLQRPRFALLDEPDSGVDLDSLKVLGDCISSLADSGVGVLLVTHRGDILRYVDRIDRAFVLINGRIVHRGPGYEVVKMISLHGFKAFMEKRGG